MHVAPQNPGGTAPVRLVNGGNIALGVALVIASALLFATGGAATKHLSGAVPPTSALIWRSLLAAAGVGAWFAVAGWPRVRSRRIDLHVARGLATFAGLWSYFLAVASIPLSTAVLLRTASPVFVPIVAYVLYRRPSDRFVWVGAWVGLTGVALVVEPAAMGLGLGDLLGIASGAFGAVGAVLIWRLGGIDGVPTQLLWLTAIGFVCGALAAPWFLTLPAPSDWPLVLVMTIATTASQVLLAHAFKVAPADKIITWGYLSVVFGGVIGAVVWGEVPSVWAMAGMVVVVLGSHLATLAAKTSG